MTLGFILYAAWSQTRYGLAGNGWSGMSPWERETWEEIAQQYERNRKDAFRN